MIVALACVCASTVARADGDAVGRANRLFKDGRRAADRGDFAHACSLFEESFRLDPGVGTLVNLGDCAEHLGDVERALGYYRTAYARMPERDDRATRVHDRIANIEEHAAKVAIHVEPDAPDATVVTVDGHVEARREGALHLTKGTHVILVTAVGYRGKRYDVSVGEGETRSLHVTPGPALEMELPTGISGPSQPSPGRGASWATPLAITALGFGVAGVWVASLAGAMAIDRRDVQRTQCDASNACTQAGVDAAHDGATWASVSTASFVAGSVLLALGATLFVVSLATRSKTSTVVGLGVGGAFVRGSFE